MRPACAPALSVTCDVSMIEGEVEDLEIDALPQDRRDRFEQMETQ
jgi:hypothetical protein